MEADMTFKDEDGLIYVKTDGGKRRLSAVEIQIELLRRVGIDSTF
jgi:hypothetical protein